jgi:hypothetical protein
MAKQDKAADQGGAWGKAVDGLACRLTVQPRYTVGEPITVVYEIKNVSDKKRYIIGFFDPLATDYVSLTVGGPKGKVEQTLRLRKPATDWSSFRPIEPGEVKRMELMDLATFFAGLAAWTTVPERKTNDVASGKYELRLRFVSPKIPPVQKIGKSGKITNAPAEILAGEWAGEIESAPASFELLPLGKEDLVIHEWGVFTVLNDSKYANANRKEEWGSLPTFFYRQFPKARLPWFPSATDKPIIYVYAKPSPILMNIKVAFAEGTPVVWWPATTDPVDNAGGPQISKNNKPYRWLIWDARVGDTAPFNPGNARVGDPLPLRKLVDFALPPDSWLQHARLAKASQLTVIGTVEGKIDPFPGAMDRSETERFLYYDGLVPAPDYLHCEKTDAASVTLRNGAAFDLRGLFVVDRRTKGKTAFAFVDDVKEPFKAGATLDVKLQPVSVADWPAAGVKQVRQALLDAGLFEPEADSVLKIWQNRLLEAEGLVAFHILPQSEYDRMLPLDVLPAPLAKPVRVGIALHPNLEIEPALRQRVAKLVKELDSDVYAQRAAASKELLEIGPVAIGVLRAALHNQPSLESRRRIEAVLDSVDGTEWLKLPKAEKKKG